MSSSVVDQQVVGPVVFRYTDVAFARAEGVYLYDAEGKRYLDFAAGIATMNVGHCHPRVVEAVIDQAQKMAHVCAAIGLHEPYVQMLEAVRSKLPGELHDGLGMLVNTGAEAVEASLKLARMVTGRPMVIGFMGSFHGRTMGALAATASSTGYRRNLSSLLSTGMYHVPYPENGTVAKISLELIEQALDTIIHPDELAAILIEPMLGEGGYVVPPETFLPALREICDRTGALLIADEVQTGFGRTGKWFAIEHTGVVPDAVCLGKAMGGGLPLAGIIAKRTWMEQWPAGAHGTTFGGNPISCRAGLAAIQVIEDENLLENAERVGEYIRQRFRDANSPIIADVRGRGMMIGVEIRTPDGKPDGDFVKHLTHDAALDGLIVLKCGHSTIRIAPPLTLTKEQADEGIEILLRHIKQHAG